MKTFSELIETLYKEQLEQVSRVKNDFELYDRFCKYMNQKYGKFLDKLNENPILKEKIFDDWYQTEIRHLGTLSSDDKYSQFTRDDALIAINDYSSKIFVVAKEKMEKGSLSDRDLTYMDSYIEEMKKMLNEILPENIDVAQKLISESSIEVDYIYGRTTNISMRLSNEKRYTSKEE